MKGLKRKFWGGNGLGGGVVGSFCCGGLMGEFGREGDGKFFLLDDALGFVGIDRVVILMGALFGLGLL